MVPKQTHQMEVTLALAVIKVISIFGCRAAYLLDYGNLCPYAYISTLKSNTHRRRRRDETVLSRRVGVGGCT